MGGRDEEDGGYARDKKGAGSGYEVQEMLEKSSDWIYGSAAFLVSLALLLIFFTPSYVEVDAIGRPVLVERPELPAALRVKISTVAKSLSDGAHSLSDTIRRPGAFIPGTFARLPARSPAEDNQLSV